MMNIREALDEHSCSFSERYQQDAWDAKKGAGMAEHSGIMGILLRIHPYIEKCRLCCMPVK